MAQGGIQTTFYPMGGGLDLVTPAIAIQPGKAIAALNYEPVAAGYQRLTGYERYDGRPSPSDVVAESREAARVLIQSVSGSGPVRGVWLYQNTLYAFRDNVGATACVMHRATPTGWQALSLGRWLRFTSGGVYQVKEGDVVTGATSGATGAVKRVVVQSGGWASDSASGYFIISPQSGSFIAENLNVGGTLNVATVAGNSTQIVFPAGGRYEFINHNFYASADTLRMYGVNGVGPAFEFDGTNLVPILTGTPAERPHRIAAHRGHLVTAHPGGNVIGSELGDPYNYSAVAGSWTFGIGDEITDFIANSTSVLTILGRNGVSNLYGNDSADFQLEVLSDESGALPWTAEKLGGAIYMDNRGVRSMASTQAYGNFRIGSMTTLIQPLLEQYRRMGVVPNASCRVRGKDQYRVFMADGRGFTIYLGKKNPEILPFDLGRVVSCIVSAEDSSARERIWMGSTDGFVYELEIGTSFDGAPIPHFLRLPFGHQGAPQNRKRYHKTVLECVAAPNTTLRVSADFDYGGPDLVPFPDNLFAITGGGGIWDVSAWEEFFWDAPLSGSAEAYLDGVGRNMSLLIAGETADEAPHLVQGVTIYFSIRGLTR